MMKVLFVSKANADGKPGVVVGNQMASLRKYGDMEISYFPITGKGISTYIKHIFKLKKFLKANRCDIVHANYSFCGFTASLAGAKPLVVSLMGSDTKTTGWLKMATRYFLHNRWTTTIVKSASMADDLQPKRTVEIIPNGVDIDLFSSVTREEALQFAQFNPAKKHIVFVGDPSRYSKNGDLAKEVVQRIEHLPIELHIVQNRPHSEIIRYMIAADVILMTSRYEGSPNVIKEAMACNKPIVSTNVGDVAMLLENVAGCYVCAQDAQILSEALIKALHFAENQGATTGVEKLQALGIDAASTARKISSIYRNFAP
jgi:teichuronic acid biosynthesis glycosyltransferase TuaC